MLLAAAAALPLLLFGGWVGYLAAVQTRAETSRNAALAVDGAASRIAAEIVAQPGARKQLVTVRGPTASSAPVAKAAVVERVRREKAARKGASQATKLGGR